MSRIAWLAVAAGTIAVQAAEASQVQVRIENTQGAGGFSMTPFWLGFHDGSFDVFDAGQPAAALAGITGIAELGDTSVLSGRFGSEQAAGIQTTLVQPDAAPVFSPGEQASMVFDLDPVDNRYFNYASMVVPSNDLFVGNDDAIALFDDGGVFLGPLTINIYGSSVWDNGSEINDLLNGGAFVDGVDAMGGADEGGVINVFLDLPGAADYVDSILGTTTADGGTVTLGFDEQTLLGRIVIVPAPGAVWALGLAGAAGLVGGRRRRSPGAGSRARASLA